MKRTIEQLAQKQGRVYVYLADDAAGAAFLRQAQDEGFTFTDGEQPTKRPYARVMALNRDRTLHYVGFVGMAAFGAPARRVNGERLLRVDFRKYAAGEKAYLL